MSASQTARARVRQELIGEITEAARAELRRVGAHELSLRAVARHLDMVPSALYRYFPSRDALLTHLIVDSYRAVGAAATAADRSAGPDPAVRWPAVTGAIRGWGLEHRQEWLLVYGSPVIGYQAPPDTIAAALEVTAVLLGIVGDAHQARLLAPVPEAADPALADSLAPVTALLPGLPVTVAARVAIAWILVFGTVTLELGGHFHNAILDLDAMFDYSMRTAAATFGLEY